jgi:hypothetical protein
VFTVSIVIRHSSIAVFTRVKPSYANVLILVAALLPSGTSRAQSAGPPRVALTLDARGEVGTGTVSGITLGAVGVGVEWRLLPTVRLRTLALFLHGRGSTDTGRSASGGGGGELGARALPFPTWPVRPYMRISAGFLLFPRAPFLPGGDLYDFILGLGAGLEIPIGSQLSVIGDLHATHLSNGQGLGPFNPAFNGYGGIVGFNYNLVPEPAAAPIAAFSPDDAMGAEPETRRVRPTPGLILDAGAGRTPESVFEGRVRVVERLSLRFLAIVDAEAQSIGGTTNENLGVGAVGHWAFATLGVQVTYEHIPGIDAIAEQAQVELHITPEASLFATGIWQQQKVFADFLTSGLGLRLFPIATVRFDGGVRLTRTFAGGADLGAGPYLAFEWQLPFGAACHLSLFAEKQLSTIELAGVRLAWNTGETSRDFARRTAWMRIR